MRSFLSARFVEKGKKGASTEQHVYLVPGIVGDFGKVWCEREASEIFLIEFRLLLCRIVNNGTSFRSPLSSETGAGNKSDRSRQYELGLLFETRNTHLRYVVLARTYVHGKGDARSLVSDDG